MLVPGKYTFEWKNKGLFTDYYVAKMTSLGERFLKDFKAKAEKDGFQIEYKLMYSGVEHTFGEKMFWIYSSTVTSKTRATKTLNVPYPYSAIKRMEVPVYIWETGIKNKIPTELEKRKLDMLRDIICLYYIVLIIPFASLKVQTSYEKCCVPPLFDL